MDVGLVRGKHGNAPARKHEVASLHAGALLSREDMNETFPVCGRFFSRDVHLAFSQRDLSSLPEALGREPEHESRFDGMGPGRLEPSDRCAACCDHLHPSLHPCWGKLGQRTVLLRHKKLCSRAHVCRPQPRSILVHKYRGHFKQSRPCLRDSDREDEVSWYEGRAVRNRTEEMKGFFHLTHREPASFHH